MDIYDKLDGYKYDLYCLNEEMKFNEKKIKTHPKDETELYAENADIQRQIWALEDKIKTLEEELDNNKSR